MLLTEEYTNEEIGPLHEDNRAEILNTKTYENLSDEDKILVSEYLELCASVAEFFYKNTKVYKFSNQTQSKSIIQIIFPNSSLYYKWINDPIYNTNYFGYLNVRVWYKLFGVIQKVSLHEGFIEPDKFDSYESAEQFILTKGSSVTLTPPKILF